MRVKLTNEISGNWAASSGDRSTFGMDTAQLVEVVDKLRDAGMLHCLTLQHSHLGSQVPDVNDVRRAVGEACRFFAELKAEGVPLTHLDLGGGLGFDYTGENKASANSVNYSVEEYCANIVETVHYAMDEAGLDHPTLITESGRATVASSSMLIFNVLEATLFDTDRAPGAEPDDHHYLSDLIAVGEYLRPERLRECLNDATFYRNEMRALFRRGHVGIRQMARCEKIFQSHMGRIKQLAAAAEDEADMEDELHRRADIYHCNFSLFQSLPDVWAIDQLHPVIPLQMLDQKPTRRAVLSDITCDSDGKVDHFIVEHGTSPSLPVHDLPEDRPYHIGVFFVGAYQETLGDLHNLFGDTNVVTIDLRADGGFDLLHEQEGDTIAEVLSYVEYDPRDCIAAFRKVVDGAVSKGIISFEERRPLMDAYRDSINGYTYYE